MSVDYFTTDKNTGRIHLIECEESVSSKTIDIKNKCFLLLVLTKGELTFSVEAGSFKAVAPTFICFDESENPVIKNKGKEAEVCAIYFHPTFLNVNMTFDLIRSEGYEKLAYDYDLFLCIPFLSHCRIIPIPVSTVSSVIRSCHDMVYELTAQRDCYWSCRARSCFIEVIVMLERAYRLMKDEGQFDMSSKQSIIDRAVEYIEGNFNRSLSYDDIIKASGTNRNTLSILFKERFGMTSFEYLTAFRIEIAKKQIEFTNVPLKDIASRCGFKTVQHFSRVFKRLVGEAPASFRTRTLEERKRKFNKESGEK